MADEDSLPDGYEISGVRIVRFLGRGGFANTYLCEHLITERLCVLKELYPLGIVYRGVDYSILRNNDAYAEDVWLASVKNFHDEVRVLQALDVPRIPQFLDAFTANQSYYLVQEYVHGMNLYEYRQILLNSDNQLALTLKLLKDLLQTLSSVHKSGILHRDIKPDNIIIQASDGSPFLIDFGGVRFQVGGVTYNLDRRVGSRGYSSPEQTTEAVEQSQSSDLYALAATFYFVLFGVEPIDSNDRLLGDSVKDFRELEGEWSSDFLASLQRAFSLSRKQRFQCAEDWLAELSEVKLSDVLKIWYVGRDPEQVDILLEGCSDTVSRVHLEIQLYAQGVCLVDRSSNGVTVLHRVAHKATVLVGEKRGHKIEGQYFLAKHEWDVELDLAGNIYKLSDLLDLESQSQR
ncbi:MAG: protein kinase [Methyloprofundus sp.]|nr:protein kinase [Methyloprofundus sp.]